MKVTWLMISQVSVLTVKSDQKIPKDGIYKYEGHVIRNNENCKILNNYRSMVFLKNQKAPYLETCDHKVYWSFVRDY